MKLTFKLTFVAIASTMSLLSQAGESWSKSDEVEANLLKRYPATKFSDIKSTPIPDLFQVTMGKNIGYVDSSGRYFLFGRLFDMEQQKDLSEPEQQSAQKVAFSNLPLKDAIKVRKGDGKRVFAVFTDPDCPYCKQLESTITRMDNYTMYLFLFPIASLHPNAPKVAKSIWCSPKPEKAFEGYVLDGVNPPAKECADPIERNIALAETLGISGTPTLIHSNGKFAPGAMPRNDLEQWLDSKEAQQ